MSRFSILSLALVAELTQLPSGSYSAKPVSDLHNKPAKWPYKTRKPETRLLQLRLS